MISANTLISAAIVLYAINIILIVIGGILVTYGMFVCNVKFGW